MPGVKEAEIKARRLRSAALLTSGLASVEKADSSFPSSPDWEQAGASTQSGSKDKIRESIIIEDDVSHADRAEDGCCAKCVQYWSGLIESGATLRVSLRGSAELQAELKSS